MIKATTKKRSRKYFAPQNEGVVHKCEHPKCNKPGEFKAPKDKTLKEYYWFCLEHVQEYNSKWNYYGDDFVEEENLYQKFKFSSHIKYNFGFDFNGSYDFFDKYSYSGGASENIRLSADERECLKLMELSYDDLTVENLKKAYKKAAKKYHPDINKADKTLEEKFKMLSTSYKSLLNKLS